MTTEDRLSYEYFEDKYIQAMSTHEKHLEAFGGPVSQDDEGTSMDSHGKV